MKKVLLLFVLMAFFFTGVHAQTPWYLTGNTGTSPSSNFVGTIDEVPLVFKTMGIERMRLLYNKAYLGIGLTTPLATLHLHNPQEVTQVPLLQLTTAGTGNAANNGFVVFSNRKNNSITFKQQDPANFFIEGVGGGLAIAHTGNIGFGTDMPEEKVHLQGKMVIERTASTASSLQFRHPDYTRDVGPGGGTYPVPYFWDIFSDYSGLKFNTVTSNGNSTQSMVIGRSGLVGIGVTIPQAKLHVGQHILADGNIITRDKLVLAPDNTGEDRWEISRTSTGLNYTYTDRLATDVLFLGSDGNIGVGKTNPASKLDVNGTLTTNALSAQTASIAGKLGIGVTGTLHTNLQIGNVWTFQDAPNGKNIGSNTRNISNADWRIEAGAASRIAFNSAGDILLQTAPTGAAGSTISNWSTVTLANNGKVGIGIAIPSAMLEVNGDILAQSAEFSGTATADELVANSATINELLKANNAEIDGNLSADALNTNSATITGKLTANDMRIENLLCAKEVKVQLANCWPDYVFSKNYNLMPLQELEQFVNKNQHLPNVPSATDVEANGIDLGEMNATLLKKVEELTLYIIQIEKRLSELESVKGGK